MKNFKHLPNADYSTTFLVKSLPWLTEEKACRTTGLSVSAAKNGYGKTEVFRHASGVIVTLYSRDGEFRIGGTMKENEVYEEFATLLETEDDLELAAFLAGE